MTADLDSNAHFAQNVREFFLARQPILNRNQDLVAYELLFRNAAHGNANVVDDLSATATVMAHVSELGLSNVVGDVLGFVNVDSSVLMSDIVGFLPADKVVLELLETIKATPDILARVAELSAAGYTFALDDVVTQSDDVRELLPFARIIKVDIKDMQLETLTMLSRQLKSGNKLLLAEKVETVDEFRTCLDLGFDYFQGYYFARPIILNGKKLSPSQLTILRLLSQIMTDADSREIEQTIKHDASLGLNLLRLVNSAGVGASQRIDSIGQALMVLGRTQLQRWLQILLYANSDKANHLTSPLLMLATTRGKLLELMAQRIHPADRGMADKAFTVGIMSLMDALFGLPMEDILGQIAVADAVRDALLHRHGIFGDMLKLAEFIERIEEAGPLLAPTLHKLNLSVEELALLQLNAFQWTNDLSGRAI